MDGPRQTVRIRPMVAEDIAQVMVIANRLRDAPHWPVGVYENMLDPAGRPLRICLVGENSEAQVVGYAVTVLIPPQGELEAIAVASGWQRRGIGRDLLRELLTRLKKLDITEVTLEVRESNQGARTFYQGAGFIEEDRRRGYYADPEEDAILLRVEIS